MHRNPSDFDKIGREVWLFSPHVVNWNPAVYGQLEVRVILTRPQKRTRKPETTVLSDFQARHL